MVREAATLLCVQPPAGRHQAVHRSGSGAVGLDGGGCRSASGEISCAHGRRGAGGRRGEGGGAARIQQGTPGLLSGAQQMVARKGATERLGMIGIGGGSMMCTG